MLDPVIPQLKTFMAMFTTPYRKTKDNLEILSGTKLSDENALGNINQRPSDSTAPGLTVEQCIGTLDISTDDAPTV